ncbi:MAG: hypothetical protein IJN84_08960 [Clostridia bacterium]|nr:hypothetical protein [Clostridia bacterium]MBQ9947552.1 hypothetical protein [Oscillospiraceae bacterium]
MQYQFDVELATEYGIDEAVFVHNLYFWIKHNEANGRHIAEYEGVTRVWSYNSMAAFSILFPFWTHRQMERIVKSCRDKGLVITANLNEDKKNRTLWYAVTEKVVLHYTKQCNVSHGSVKCISNIYNNINLSTDSNTDIEDAPLSTKRVKSEGEGKTAYGEFGYVKLTDKELQRLIEKYGKETTAKAIEYVDMHAAKTKNKNGWKDWNAVIHNCIRNNWGGVKDD